jgi:hypothetical protein
MRYASQYCRLTLRSANIIHFLHERGFLMEQDEIEW